MEEDLVAMYNCPCVWRPVSVGSRRQLRGDCQCATVSIL